MPPGRSNSYGWLEVNEIAERLAEKFPQKDPLTVKFVELRALAEGLEGFKEVPGHPVNERILETIQMKWYEEYKDLKNDEDDE